MNSFTILFFWLPIAILLSLLLVQSVAQLKGKDRVAHIAECVIWWMTVSLVLPSRLKKYGLIRRGVYRWGITLLSPAAIVTDIIIILVTIAFYSPSLPYDELDFTSRNDIAAITEIPDFPEFEYRGNRPNSWDGTYVVQYRFKDEDAADKLFATLRQKCCTDDSIFWSQDSIGSEYVCHRGWDGAYVPYPTGINKSAQVKIVIDRRGFTLKHEPAPMIYLEDLASPDNLQQFIGVRLPNYHFVNIHRNYMSIDASTELTIRLNTLPSKALIRAIERNDKWTKRDDGTYRFELFSDEMQMYITAVLDPRSYYVTIERGMY